MTDADDPMSVGDGIADLGENFLLVGLVGMATLSFIVGGGLYVYLHAGAPGTAESGVSWALVPAVLICGALALLGLVGLVEDGYGYARRAWSSWSNQDDPAAATDGGLEKSAETAGGDRNRQQTTTKHD